MKIAVMIGVILGMLGCGSPDECARVPDGFYVSDSGTGYTFQGGLPIGLSGWTCTEASCGNFTCVQGVLTEDVTIAIDGPLVFLSFSSPPIRLILKGH